jgi:hypothetical protein
MNRKAFFARSNLLRWQWGTVLLTALLIPSLSYAVIVTYEVLGTVANAAAVPPWQSSVGRPIRLVFSYDTTSFAYASGKMFVGDTLASDFTNFKFFGYGVNGSGVQLWRGNGGPLTPTNKVFPGPPEDPDYSIPGLDVNWFFRSIPRVGPDGRIIPAGGMFQSTDASDGFFAGPIDAVQGAFTIREIVPEPAASGLLSVALSLTLRRRRLPAS